MAYLSSNLHLAVWLQAILPHLITPGADTVSLAAGCYGRRFSHNDTLSQFWGAFRGKFKVTVIILSHLPYFKQPWALLIKAQQTLYASNQMVQRIERLTNETPPPDLGTQIKNLDTVISALMTKSDQYLRYTFDEDGEGLIAENMWRISRIVIYT